MLSSEEIKRNLDILKNRYLNSKDSYDWYLYFLLLKKYYLYIASDDEKYITDKTNIKILLDYVEELITITPREYYTEQYFEMSYLSTMQYGLSCNLRPIKILVRK